MRTCIVFVLLLTLCACKVGPNYQRPPLTVPGDYRGVAPDASTQPQPTSEQFAEMKWPAVYQDEVLQGLIKEALANNYDIQIAATRILQANANLGITRANQFPTVNGSASVVNERNGLYPGAPTFDILGVQLNYIVDFWGQYRRATESARATLLATKYGQGIVQTTLISSLASNYFLLRQFDFQFDYSKQTVEADKEILDLNNVKFKGGESAITDVYQAQALVEQAEAEVITLKQSIEQAENNISILLGRNPGPIPRGLTLTEQPHLPEVPAGLPSALL
jgi:multidrug efflux system outer membrane protein